MRSSPPSSASPRLPGGDATQDELALLSRSEADVRSDAAGRSVCAVVGENSDEDAATDGVVAGDSRDTSASEVVPPRVMLALPRQSDVAASDPSFSDPEWSRPIDGLPAAVVSEMQQEDCWLSEALVRPRRRDPDR